MNNKVEINTIIKTIFKSAIKILVLLVIIFIIIFAIANKGEDSREKIMDRDIVIDQYWDEIKEFVNGTETINACSENSGNCYDVDADIYHGTIDQIYFENGGRPNFGADIDENGDASDFSSNGEAWSFNVDMDSTIIDDAIAEWATTNDYIIR